MERKELLNFLEFELKASQIKDYCPNGLQVEGREKIQKIVTGVTASQALIDKAISIGADTIIVHHGYFWKGESSCITGMKQKRLKTLLMNDINLIAYHLPIDVHPVLGNNAQIGKLLEVANVQPLPNLSPEGIVMMGELKAPLSHVEFTSLLSSTFQRTPVIDIPVNQTVSRVAWCSGGGQSFIDSVAQHADELHIDAFFSGEISEQTTHSAQEQGISYFAVGHHASEKYGVKALGEYIAEKFDVAVEFINVENPA